MRRTDACSFTTGFLERTQLEIPPECDPDIASRRESNLSDGDVEDFNPELCCGKLERMHSQGLSMPALDENDLLAALRDVELERQEEEDDHLRKSSSGAQNDALIKQNVEDTSYKECKLLPQSEGDKLEGLRRRCSVVESREAMRSIELEVGMPLNVLEDDDFSLCQHRLTAGTAENAQKMEKQRGKSDSGSTRNAKRPTSMSVHEPAFVTFVCCTASLIVIAGCLLAYASQSRSS